MKIYKICKYCHGINKVQSNRCTKCGRFKNNLILEEYSPIIDTTLTDEDIKIAQKNFIPKTKYPHYKGNIVPTKEVYPVVTKTNNNLILDVRETIQPPMPYVSKYDTKINKQKALEEFYLITNRRDDTQRLTSYDLIEKAFNYLFDALKNNLLFRYIFGISLIVIFLIWFLGGLFTLFV